MCFQLPFIAIKALLFQVSFWHNTKVWIMQKVQSLSKLVQKCTKFAIHIYH